jgi:hypothetical protein
MRKFVALVFVMLLFSNLYSQDYSNYLKYGTILKIKLNNAMFPHPQRSDGYRYRDQKFSFEEHYNDNSVLIFIPSYLKKTGKTNFVVHFHGWYNNVDSVIEQFDLIQQFYDSKKNAILIIPQGPKNAPDSFGGKLEEKDVFRNFIFEISDTLKKNEVIKTKEVGNIILSGHSGAYRVIAYILQRGGMLSYIREVFLFDALYGHTDKYTYWIDHYRGKLINIYTDNGGTKEESETLFDDLKEWGFNPFFSEEKDLSESDILKNKYIFIHTQLDHNQVLYKNNNFYFYLTNSSLK